MQNVKLYWRTDNDGENPLNEYDNELYAHNPAKNSAWNVVEMTGDWYPTVKGPQVPDPANRAKRYQAPINGQNNVLIDYFVEATDTKGNTSRSDLEQVWVGAANDGGGGGGGGGGNSLVTTEQPVPGGPVTIRYAKAGTVLGGAQVYIHVGHSGWKDVILPNPAMTDDGTSWVYYYQPPAGVTQINFAFRSASNQWDNNSGGDYTATVTGGTPEIPAAPAGLTATAAAHDRVNLAWTAVPGATSYKIRRGAAQIGTSATASFADTTVQASTTYSYTVVASNSAGDSASSVAVSATTPVRPVEVPEFVLSGQNRPGYLLASPGMKIHAAVRGTKLYVATWFASPQNGNDHFIFVTDQLLASASAPMAVRLEQNRPDRHGGNETLSRDGKLQRLRGMVPRAGLLDRQRQQQWQHCRRRHRSRRGLRRRASDRLHRGRRDGYGGRRSAGRPGPRRRDGQRQHRTRRISRHPHCLDRRHRRR